MPETKRLMIYLGESDRWHHQPAYLAILELLRKEGCAGATVVRGIAGFGAESRIKTSTILRLSMDLPVVVTVVDRVDRIERFLPALKEMVGGGLMTIEDIGVVKYTPILRQGLPNLPVEEVMTKEVVAVAPDSPVFRVIEILVDKDYTALPVVDAERRLLGMVGDTDILESGDVSTTLSVPRAAGPSLVREMLARLRQSTRTAAEVMKPAATIDRAASLADAARLMTAKGVKRLPVVGADHRLCGMLGRLDLLKTMASAHLPHHPEHAAASSSAPHRIADVMSREVPTVSPDAALDEILDRVVGSPVKRVIVVDSERRPLGIITDTDLVQRLSPDASTGVVEILRSKIPIDSIGGEARKHLQRIRGRRAAEIMTAPAISVREDTPFADAIAVSAERHVKRFPVVDREGKLAGIVGRMELLGGFLRTVEGTER
jgi:CBS domain-containing protein